MFTMEFYDDDGRLDHNATVRCLTEANEIAQGRTMKITGMGTMSHDEAMIEINEYGEAAEKVGLLDTLQAMQGALAKGLLSMRQEHAYDTIMSGMRKLFHGGEA